MRVRMSSRKAFLTQLAKLETTHLDRAIALLWYYRQVQEFEERTASELANDLNDEGFPKPNVTRLDASLVKGKYAVRGRRAKSLKLDLRYLLELDELYSSLLGIRTVKLNGLFDILRGSPRYRGSV